MVVMVMVVMIVAGGGVFAAGCRCRQHTIVGPNASDPVVRLPEWGEAKRCLLGQNCAQPTRRLQAGKPPVLESLGSSGR